MYNSQNNRAYYAKTLTIDNPLEYARLALNDEMQALVDAEDSLEKF